MQVKIPSSSPDYLKIVPTGVILKPNGFKSCYTAFLLWKPNIIMRLKLYTAAKFFFLFSRSYFKKTLHTRLVSRLIIRWYSLLSRVIRNILWIMWLTLSCSQSSCRDRKERLISATESSLSSTLSETEFSDSDWLSPESSAKTVETERLWTILKSQSQS